METATSYDLIIIGCGPAGLSAAINAKIRQKNLLLLGGDFCTARLYKAPHIDNYLGFPNISGKELRERFLQHLNKMDIQVRHDRVSSIYPLGNQLQVLIKDEVVTTTAIILATGLSTPKYLTGEQELLGKGVGYCATCDGPLYRGKNVIVLGETVEAEEEANFLAEICKSVTYLSLYGKPQKLKNTVNIIAGKPVKVVGETRFTALETDRGSFEADGLFIIREFTPVSQLLPDLPLENNFIKVDHNMATGIPGVFAAGDCTGPPFQVAKSVGEGLVAALNAVKYIDRITQNTSK